MNLKQLKQTIGMFGLAASLSVPAQAATNLDQLDKELEIMSSILSTALKQDNRRDGLRFRGLDTTYLAGQGIMFEIQSSSRGWQFNFNFQEFLPEGVHIPEPVVAPDPIRVYAGGSNIVIDLDEDELDDITAEAMEKVVEAREESREKLRELREQERELAWENREYERRIRDIEFEKRHADEERRVKLEVKVKEALTEKQKLDERMKIVSKYAQELEEERKAQLEKQAAMEKEQYKRFLAGFETNIADILCKYGAGLKSLPENEHVSFVLPDFMADGDSRKRKDRIYVFDYEDVRDCVAEKINTDKLLSKAQTYMF